MKKKTIIASIIGTALLFVGCAAGTLSGTTPPTKLEQALYQTQTNYITKTVVNTNTVTETNVVTATNTVGQVITATNYQTQTITTTNTVLQPVYTFDPKASTAAGAQAAGSFLNGIIPGAGTAAGYAALFLIGIWGHLRSYKKDGVIDALGNQVDLHSNTADALAQEVETAREFIKSLPNGTKYDQALTQFFQQHQVEAGVAQQVLSILSNNISNPEAQVAAKEISTTVGIITKPA